MAILRAMVVGQRFFKLQAADTKDNKTRMLLSTFISVPVDTLAYWLQHGGEDPESVLSEESAVEKLRRYEFEELVHTAEGLAKTFGAEIDAAHPMSADTPTASDFTRHELAMKLVGERHAKYELVDLVNWLLRYKEAAEPATTSTAVSTPSGKPQVEPDYANRAFTLDDKPLSVVEFDELVKRQDEYEFGLMAFTWRSDLKRDDELLSTLAQYRNDMLSNCTLTGDEVLRRVAMIEATAALIPGGAEFMNPPHEKAA